MNAAEVGALPAVLDVGTAAKVMGLSRTAAYELIRADAWPTPVVRLGRLIRIPTVPLLDLLGVHRDGVQQDGARPWVRTPVQPAAERAGSHA